MTRVVFAFRNPNNAINSGRQKGFVCPRQKNPKTIINVRQWRLIDFSPKLFIQSPGYWEVVTAMKLNQSYERNSPLDFYWAEKNL